MAVVYPPASAPHGVPPSISLNDIGFIQTNRNAVNITSWNGLMRGFVAGGINGIRVARHAVVHEVHTIPLKNQANMVGGSYNGHNPRYAEGGVIATLPQRASVFFQGQNRFTGYPGGVNVNMGRNGPFGGPLVVTNRGATAPTGFVNGAGNLLRMPLECNDAQVMATLICMYIRKRSLAPIPVGGRPGAMSQNPDAGGIALNRWIVNGIGWRGVDGVLRPDAGIVPWDMAAGGNVDVHVRFNQPVGAGLGTYIIGANFVPINAQNSLLMLWWTIYDKLEQYFNQYDEDGVFLGFYPSSIEIIIRRRGGGCRDSSQRLNKGYECRIEDLRLRDYKSKNNNCLLMILSQQLWKREKMSVPNYSKVNHELCTWKEKVLEIDRNATFAFTNEEDLKMLCIVQSRFDTALTILSVDRTVLYQKKSYTNGKGKECNYSDEAIVVFHEGHYLEYVKVWNTEKTRCKDCGAMFILTHNCNARAASYYQRVVCRSNRKKFTMKPNKSAEKDEIVSVLFRKNRKDDWRIPHPISKSVKGCEREMSEAIPFEEEEIIFWDIETFVVDREAPNLVDREHKCYAIGWYGKTPNEVSEEMMYQEEFGRESVKEFVRYLKDIEPHVVGYQKIKNSNQNDLSIPIIKPYRAIAWNGGMFDLPVIMREIKKECLEYQDVIRLSNPVVVGGRMLSICLQKRITYDDDTELKPAWLDHIVFNDAMSWISNCGLEKACRDFKLDAATKKSCFPHLRIGDYDGEVGVDQWLTLDELNDEKFYFGKMTPYTKEDIMNDSIEYSENHDTGEIFDISLRSICSRYLKRDVMSMHTIILRFWDMLRDISKFGEPDRFPVEPSNYMTISQYSLAVLLESEHGGKIMIPYEQSVRDDFRLAVAGGRVYPSIHRFVSDQLPHELQEFLLTNDITKDTTIPNIYGLKYEDIHHCYNEGDATSLYPSVMKQYKYPDGPILKCDDMIINRLNGDLENHTPLHMMGIYKVSYIANHHLLQPVLSSFKEGHDATSSVGLDWSVNDGEGWYTSVDLDRARRYGYTITIKAGYYWKRGCELFKHYVEHFYKVKDEAQIEKNEAKKVAAKCLLNSPYGKMLQKVHRKKNQYLYDEQGWNEFVADVIPTECLIIGDACMLTGQSKQEALGNGNPIHIGCFILSYSKEYMSNMMEKVDPFYKHLADVEKLDKMFETDRPSYNKIMQDAVAHQTAYTDTDSLYCLFENMYCDYGSWRIVFNNMKNFWDLSGRDYRCAAFYKEVALECYKHKLTSFKIGTDLGDFKDEALTDGKGGKILFAFWAGKKNYAYLAINCKNELSVTMRCKGFGSNMLNFKMFATVDEQPEKTLAVTDENKIKHYLLSSDEYYCLVHNTSLTRTYNKTVITSRFRIDGDLTMNPFGTYSVPHGHKLTEDRNAVDFKLIVEAERAKRLLVNKIVQDREPVEVVKIVRQEEEEEEDLMDYSWMYDTPLENIE